MPFPTSQLLPLFHNSYLDIITNGTYWVLGPDRTLPWSISDGYYGEYWINPSAVVDYVSLALGIVSSYANIDFEYVGYYDNPDDAYFWGSDLNFSLDGEYVFFDSEFEWALGNFPYEPWETYWGEAGDIYVNINSEANFLPSYAPGTQGWFLLLHEIGHTLGLKHTHDTGGTGRPTAFDVDLGAFDIDWMSIMSYEDDFDDDYLAFDPATPMILDVLGLQAIYGVNYANNTGDDVYAIDLINAYITYWDAAGNDTLDASASLVGWFIMLPELVLTAQVPEPIGYAQILAEYFLETPTTLYWLEGDIENATGSWWDDVIAGNSLANRLTGLGGDDRFGGSFGRDIIDGGTGLDSTVYDLFRDEVSPDLMGNGSVILQKPFGDFDTLSGMERIELLDGTFVYGLGPNADLTYRMYTAAYFRTPDEGGFRYWTDVMDRPELGGDGNLSYGDKLVLAREFLKADEFKQVYGGPNPTNEHYVELMYENVLKREFDQEGRDYWLGRMAQGAGRDEILTVFVDSNENLFNTVADRSDGFWVL